MKKSNQAKHVSNKITVIHLVRAVGSTSMPWNDLYEHLRLLSPGTFYLPLVVSSFWGGRSIKWEKTSCNNKRRYIDVNLISGLSVIRRIYNRSDSRVIVHIHNPILAILALFCKMFFPKVIVITNLHNDWKYFKFHQKIGLYILGLISNIVVTVSESIVDSIPRIVRRYHKKNSTIIPICNGIYPSQLKIFSINEKRKNQVVVVARMVPQKNCLFIIDLFDKLPMLDKLIWFGDGVEKNIIKQRVSSLGLDERVILKGRCPRDEIYRELANSSFYLAASKWEGIGVANIEAAALGCFPLLSDIPPHREIADALGICVYPLGNKNIWIQAVSQHIALNSKKREKIVKNIANIAKDKYDMTKSVSLYMSVYERYM